MSAVTRLQILRGTTAQRTAFIPLKGELIMDLESGFLYIGDGVTFGGVLAAPLAASTDRIIAVVRNESGATIPKGTPVCIVGASGGGIALIEKSDASNPARLGSIGLLENDVPNNASGIVLIEGTLSNLNTSAYDSGDDLFVAVGGGLTDDKPVEPNFIERVAKAIVISATVGSVTVRLNDVVSLPNLPANHIPIGVGAGHTTTVDADAKIAANAAVIAAQASADAAQADADAAQADIDAHEARTDNPHSTTKAQVGLGNVDNTSDLNKPISTATQTALNLKYDASNPNGYETPTQLNARDTANRARANHTGTQLAATISDFAATVLATVLSGYAVGANTALAATDTILQAFQKVQGQINARALAARQILAGYGLTGGGDLTADRTLSVSLSTVSVEANSSQASTASMAAVAGGAFNVSLPAGTWLVSISARITSSANDARGLCEMYLGGVAQANTQRGIGVNAEGGGGLGGSAAVAAEVRQTVHMQKIVSPGSTQTLEMRWQHTAGGFNITDRSIIATRIA